MIDVLQKCKEDGGYFGKYRVMGDNFFSRPILEGVAGPHMKFEGKDVIIWSLNNYLGLTGKEEIKEAARQALDEYGTCTPMGSRMLTGNTMQHIELENKLADFCQKPSAVLFNYGYLGVIGTISAVVGMNDLILIDKLSHSSMIDATIVASFGKRFRAFKHNNMESLELHLKRASRDCKGGILIITEGVFGMRGDLADLKSICELKDKYGARLFVDDAHGFGVMGENGRGTGEYFNVQDKIDLYFGTFAKAFAAIGGVTAGEKEVTDYIRYNARTYVFAKSLPLIYVKVIEESLRIVKNDPSIRKRMWDIAKKLQDGLRELGYDIGDTLSPITPVYVPAGDLPTGESMVKMLRYEYGVFVSGVVYPVVPPGVILFRLIPTALHTEEDVEVTLNAFKMLRDRLKLDLSMKSSKMNK